MDAKEYLTDFTFHFIKNKDLILRQIDEIELTKGDFDIDVTFKDKKQLVMVSPQLKDISLDRFQGASHFGLATFNTKENFDFLLSNWKDLAKIANLTIYFFNPFSQMDKKWIIRPKTHDSICDQAALKKGLASMFETVPIVPDSKLKGTFK